MSSVGRSNVRARTEIPCEAAQRRRGGEDGQPIRSHAQSASRGNARGGLRLVLRDRRLLMVGLGGLTGMLVFSGLLTASLGFYLRQRYGDEVAVLGTVIGVASKN